MKVIYFTDTYYSEHGGRTHAREFFKALSKHEQISEVIVYPAETNKSTEWNNSKLNSNRKAFTCIKSLLKQIVPTNIRILYRLYFPKKSIYNELATLIKSVDPELLIIRHSNNFKYISRLHTHFPQLKLVIEFNASPFSEAYSNIPFVNYWRKEEIRNLSKANCISAVSGYLKNYLVRANPNLEKKVIVNPNGVDITRFTPLPAAIRNKKRNELGIPEHAIVFGYMGGMEKFRRLPEVVERFAGLRKKGYENIFLMLIGHGADLENIIAVKEKNKSVFTNYFYCNGDWVPHEDVPLWLNCFDVGIFPFSNDYGSPQKIFEYAAFELPVFGPDVPALTNGTGRELCTVLVKQDGSNFDEIVIYIYNNFETIKMVGHNGRVIVEKNFTWDANVNRILGTIM